MMQAKTERHPAFAIEMLPEGYWVGRTKDGRCVFSYRDAVIARSNCVKEIAYQVVSFMRKNGDRDSFSGYN